MFEVYDGDDPFEDSTLGDTRCWSCAKLSFEVDARNNDGFCPCCGAEFFDGDE